MCIRDSSRTARRVLPCSTAVEKVVALESGSGAVTDKSMAISPSRLRGVALCTWKNRGIYARRECRNGEVKKTREGRQARIGKVVMSGGLAQYLTWRRSKQSALQHVGEISKAGAIHNI